MLNKSHLKSISPIIGYVPKENTGNSTVALFPDGKSLHAELIPFEFNLANLTFIDVEDYGEEIDGHYLAPLVRAGVDDSIRFSVGKSQCSKKRRNKLGYRTHYLGNN